MSLELMLSRLDVLKNAAVENRAVNLHLGCGPQILPGFVNIDKYHEHEHVVKMDLSKLAFADSSVQMIYSSHALEHLPFRRAKLALHEWARVLRPNGELYLAIPDLESTMAFMLDPDVAYSAKWNWYIYTMFGYQVDPSKYANNQALDLPDDEGQFHKCGFTEQTITQFLGEAGLRVTECFKYDGYGTLSLFVTASKRG